MQLHFLVAAEINPFIMVVHRYGQGDLGFVLPNHILVQHALDFLGRGQLVRNFLQTGGAGVLEPIVQNAHAKLDAFVADAHARSLNHSVNLLLMLPAEGAAKSSFGVVVHGITSVLPFRKGAISDW
ncbi:hypothetical protein SDC9_178686 [bioreactor metagenome]|uniref:Uncharacterized protein n=1 Tax=bioreactor metagenome TaxID=1076179 RepID=A0A645GYS8_9ZZZZ